MRRTGPSPAATGSAEERAAASRIDDAMFTDAPLGIVRLDGEGVESAVMLDANRALVEMTGGRAQPGTRFADLFVADQGTAALAEELTKALDGARTFKLAGSKDRSADVFVMLDRRGRPAAAYVIDTTEKRDLEKRLAQGEKLQALGNMAGGLAHEFNNMLLGIILNVNKLEIRHPPGDPTFYELKSINEFAARGSQLIRTMLAFTRQQTFVPEVFDGDILLFNSTIEREGSDATPEVWRPYLSGVLESYKIFARHDRMTKAGPLAEIGPLIAAKLRDLAF